MLSLLVMVAVVACAIVSYTFFGLIFGTIVWLGAVCIFWGLMRWLVWYVGDPADAFIAEHRHHSPTNDRNR